MCMGYAKEIKAWVCDEARSQREVMMDAWSTAFEATDDAIDVQPNGMPDLSAPSTAGDLAGEPATYKRSRISI